MRFSGNGVMLSVRLMTYNHEKYIAEAIEGCLGQEIDFNYEIIIGDDFSTDNTLAICKSYAEKYPDKIRLLDRPIGGEYDVNRKKLGRLYNFVDILNHCEGKYIALLDGDDYWINSDKLIKQIDVLESNIEHPFCFHNCTVKGTSGEHLKEMSFINGTTISQNDLLLKTKNNFVPSSSVILRKQCLPTNFPDWFFKQPMGDWILLLLLLDNERTAYYIDEPWSVYRQEGQGLWENYSNIKMVLKKRDFIQNLKHLPLHVDERELDILIDGFDKDIDFFVADLEKRDYYNLNVKQTIKHLLYRVNYALKNAFKK